MSSIPEDVTITPVQSEEDLTATISLFKAYVTSLGIDLTFQDFSSEMASMPGKYSSDSRGALFLARRSDGEAVGCVGLRCLSRENGASEMKRLYVAPKGRGLGVGKALASAVVAEARRLAYRMIMLDTLGSMAAARALYAGLGFVEVGAYYDTPLEDTVFLRLDLASEEA